MSGAEEEKAGFLARWSRRKLAPEVRAEPDLPLAAPGEPGPEREAAAPSLRPPAACPIPGGPEIDLASLPKLEDLTVASDLTPFLRAGVPAALRNAALRRMWSLDPGIRDFINSVDYQWDFNTPGGLPPGFANELLGDVGKLLAQAVGDHPKPEVSLAEADPNGPPQEARLPEQLPAGGEPPIVTSGTGEDDARTADVQAAEAHQAATRLQERPAAPGLAMAEPVAPEPATPRRRHGAALPV